MNIKADDISQSIKVYSFDIFDTCITRVYAHPCNLFYDLAPLFLKRYTFHGYDDNSLELFVNA